LGGSFKRQGVSERNHEQEKIEKGVQQVKETGDREEGGIRREELAEKEEDLLETMNGGDGEDGR